MQSTNLAYLLDNAVAYREVTTTDATTPTLLIDYEPPDNHITFVQLQIVGIDPIAIAMFEKTRRVAYYRVSGTLTQLDTAEVISSDCQDNNDPTAAGVVSQISGDGKRIEITGLGQAATTLYWSTWMHMTFGPF